MEFGKRESRRWKQNCNSSCRGWTERCAQLSRVLLVCTALICAVLLLHNHSLQEPPCQEAEVGQSANCSDKNISDQDYYYDYIRKHASLKIKVLSEKDGVFPLESRRPARPREITIVTQASEDRWPNLEKMASSWGGTLCAAVHVKTQGEIAAMYEKIKRLHERIEAQSYCRLHLKLVMEEGFESETDAISAPYPVNALRNVALGMAQTELVFVLDADFVPGPGLHEKLTSNETTYWDLVGRARDGRQLLVVPAFQLQEIVPVGVILEESIPQNMEELRERWQNNHITSFRTYHPVAHDSTGYGHFMHPLTKEPYHVQYRDCYEPYFVAARTIISKYDERFRGYGKNKISHAYQSAANGMSFVVLPEVYVWDNPHPKTADYHQFLQEKNDPCRGSIMNVVYDVFKKELQNKARLSTPRQNPIASN